MTNCGGGVKVGMRVAGKFTTNWEAKVGSMVGVTRGVGVGGASVMGSSPYTCVRGAYTQPTPFSTQSVKQMVQVVAHTSAWVQRQGDVWLLTFTEQSCYAGCSLRFGDGVIQLPLPIFKDIHFSHF